MTVSSADRAESSHLEQRREGAANSLAAALVKANGGDLTRAEQWQPALHAARNTVDAIAEFVLAQQRAQLSSMHEVVRLLHAEQSGAWLDLIEFDHAQEEILNSLILLSVSSSDLQRISQKLSAADSDTTPTPVRALQECAQQLSSRVTETLIDFCQLRRAALDWGMAQAAPNYGRTR